MVQISPEGSWKVHSASKGGHGNGCRVPQDVVSLWLLVFLSGCRGGLAVPNMQNKLQQRQALQNPSKGGVHPSATTKQSSTACTTLAQRRRSIHWVRVRSKPELVVKICALVATGSGVYVSKLRRYQRVVLSGDEVQARAAQRKWAIQAAPQTMTKCIPRGACKAFSMALQNMMAT